MIRLHWVYCHVPQAASLATCQRQHLIHMHACMLQCSDRHSWQTDDRSQKRCCGVIAVQSYSHTAFNLARLGRLFIRPWQSTQLRCTCCTMCFLIIAGSSWNKSYNSLDPIQIQTQFRSGLQLLVETSDGTGDQGLWRLV